MFQVLVVEDDSSLRRLISAALKQNGYIPFTAEDGEKALDVLEKTNIDLIISDIMMPNMDGYELTRQLRQAKYDIPILMVTAKESFEDKQKGFMAGTDDYMVKPVDEEEMLLRISALLRRSQIANDHKVTAGDTVFDYDTLTVIHGAQKTELPLKEFMLIYKLLSYPNKIFTRRQLMDEIWDMASDTDERTVDVHVNRLRERFKDNCDFEIVTVRGLGYKAVKTGE